MMGLEEKSILRLTCWNLQHSTHYTNVDFSFANHILNPLLMILNKSVMDQALFPSFDVGVHLFHKGNRPVFDGLALEIDY